MKIGIIGASGQVGSHIIREALLRKHETTAIVLNKDTLPSTTLSLEKDLFSLTTDHIQIFEYIINAFAPVPNDEKKYVEATEHLLTILQPTNTKLFMIGSSGCLFLNEAKKKRLLETDDYPEHLTTISKYQLESLQQLKQSSVNWTWLNPAKMFDAEGHRVGYYKIGKEVLIVNEQQQSYISYGDFAVVVLDEIEKPQHLNKVFTAASDQTTTAS